MATFTTPTTLGGTTTDATFVDNTRIWAGGGTSFDATEIFDVANGITATAVDATIACTFLGTDSGLATTPAVGTIDLTNTTVYANNSAERSSANNWDFDNVTYVDNSLTRTINIGRFAGDLGTLTSYQIDGFNLYGNVDTTDSTLGFLVFFPDFRRLTAGSTLNNISLWNGETGADILGSVFTYSYSIFSGLRSGPIGFRPFFDAGNTNTSTRALFRCAFGPDNQLNQHGHLLSYDFRAIEGLTGQWRFACDNAGRTTIVNPLVGTLTSGRLAWSCGQNSLNSAFRSYIGHTPSIEGDAIFANASVFTPDPVGAPTTTVELPMVTFPETWTANVLPTVATTNILTQVEGSTSTVVNGLGFETESGALGNGGSNGVNYLATTANAANIAYTYPTAQNYRVYSWQQGDWGKLVPITPTETGATDAQVEADRASGLYPFCTPTGFATTRNINGPLDPLELNAGLTPAQANAQRNLVVGSIVARNTNEIGMHSKAVSYNAAQVAGSHTALVPLIHTLTGTELNFGSQNLSIGTQSTIQPNSNSVTGTTFGIRASDITIGVDAAGIPVADVISTNGTVLLEDYGTGTATNKATIAAGTTSGGNMVVTHTTDATMRNLTLTGGGTFLATGETFDGCDLDFDIIDGSNTTHSNSTIAVGTIYRDIQSDTNTNVTYTGTFDAQISGANNTAYSLEDLLGTGFNTSGATITFTLGGNTGLSVGATQAELTAANIILGTGITRDEPIVTETITLAAPTSGRYGIKQTISGTTTTVVNATNIVSGTPITRSITSATFNNGDSIEFIFKFDSVLGGDVYQEQKVTHTFGSGNASIPITPPAANFALTNTAITGSVTFVETTTNNTFNVSGATTRRDGTRSQGSAIEFANTDAYFDAFFARTQTTPLFQFAADNGVAWVSGVFTFQSGEVQTITASNAAGGGTTQVSVPSTQLFTNWTGFTTINTRSGNNEVTSLDAPNAALGTVVEATVNGINQAGVATLQNQVDMAAGLPGVAIGIPAPVVLTDQPS